MNQEHLTQLYQAAEHRMEELYAESRVLQTQLKELRDRRDALPHNHPDKAELTQVITENIELLKITNQQHLVTTEQWKEAGARLSELRTAPKRQRDEEAWKLSIRIIKGASCQNLRRRLYQFAEQHMAHSEPVESDGPIKYEAPVTGTSDLVADLYFGSRRDAQGMETVVMEAVRDRWQCPQLPITSITCESIDIASLKRVFAHHFAPAASPPERFDCVEEDEHSAATTVLDAEEIARESVVDFARTRSKFEKCHIDASIKGTKADTTGNHIPLPFDWHGHFDGYTSDNIASISIVAAEGETGTAQSEADGRAPVVVHVYLYPRSPDAPQFAPKLRDATMVRPNVFSAKVWKKEAPFFVANLKKRHDAVIQQWTSVP